jgi:addiction module HigA family antidote
MMLSHPGAIIREDVLAPLKLDVTKAAKVLGVREATLSDLLNEKAGLSPEMALRIELAFGVSMEMLLRIQTAWDIGVIRKRQDEFNISRFEPEHSTS